MGIFGRVPILWIPEQNYFDMSSSTDFGNYHMVPNYYSLSGGVTFGAGGPSKNYFLYNIVHNYRILFCHIYIITMMNDDVSFYIDCYVGCLHFIISIILSKIISGQKRLLKISDYCLLEQCQESRKISKPPVWMDEVPLVFSYKN